MKKWIHTIIITFLSIVNSRAQTKDIFIYKISFEERIDWPFTCDEFFQRGKGYIDTFQITDKKGVNRVMNMIANTKSNFEQNTSFDVRAIIMIEKVHGEKDVICMGLFDKIMLNGKPMKLANTELINYVDSLPCKNWNKLDDR